jgi:hypothetical protein
MAAMNGEQLARLDYSGLLPDDLWQQLYAQTGEPSQAARSAVAGHYLIGRMSGTGALGLLSLDGELDFRGLITLVNDFRASLTASVEAVLDEYAHHFLAQQNIAEPVHSLGSGASGGSVARP